MPAYNLGSLKQKSREVNKRSLEVKPYTELRKVGIGTARLEISALKLVEEGKGNSEAST